MGYSALYVTCSWSGPGAGKSWWPEKFSIKQCWTFSPMSASQLSPSSSHVETCELSGFRLEGVIEAGGTKRRRLMRSANKILHVLKTSRKVHLP